MFLKIQFLETQKRYEDLFMANRPKYVFVFVKRITCAKNADFKNAPSSAVCYAWFVWQKGFSGNTTIEWIL